MAAGNLHNCLDVSCGIPTDVRFLFNEQEEEVNAHKLILAVASDVFTREFYGSMKEKEDVKIVDACQEVFQAMVEFIYDKVLDWGAFDLPFLCSLYYVAEKYDIKGLKAEILMSVRGEQRRNVNMTNVLEVATLAEENSHFEPLSEQLFQISVACLERNFRGGSYQEVARFCATAADPSLLPKLMEKLLNYYKPNCEPSFGKLSFDLVLAMITVRARDNMEDPDSWSPGVQRYEIMEILGDKFSEFEVDEALDYLCREEFIHQTIDEDHFIPIDNY